MKQLILILLILISVSSCFAELKIGNWTLFSPKVKPTAKEQLAYCLKLETEKKYHQARIAHKLLLRHFKHKDEAEESYIRIGELYMLEGKLKKAEKYYFKLIEKQFKATAKIFGTLKQNRKKRKGWGKKKYDEKSRSLIFQILLKNRDKTDSPLVNMDFDRTLTNLFHIGRAYQGIITSKISNIKKGKRSSKFERIYRYILRRAPGFTGSAYMQNEIAKLQLKRKKYLEAIIEFRKLTLDYSLSDEAEEADFFVGICHLGMSRGPGYNEQNLNNARTSFKDHIITYPSSKHVKLAHEKLAEIKNLKAQTELMRIKFFIRRKQWHAAGIYLNDLFKNYPNSTAFKKGKALLKNNKKIQMPTT